MMESISDDEQLVQQDVQYWYSNDTDVEASGSDKSDNESDDVMMGNWANQTKAGFPTFKKRHPYYSTLWSL